MKYLAIDVGGTFTKYAVMDEECRILYKGRRSTVLEPLEAFLDSLTVLYEETRQEYDLAGIALSMPGMIDSRQGYMYTGGNIRCISHINIVRIMENRCKVPVTVENDAKCAALAELWRGALKGCKNAVVIVCGTGVGGAVICDGNVLRGSHYMAGEFSYIQTESNSDYQLEDSLAENAGIRALLGYVSEETGIPAEKLNGIKVFAMANANEERVLAGLRRYVKHIAVQIHNYQYILDPERFAIGGGISEQPLFIEMIREELKKLNEIFPWSLPIPEVTACRFFNDANLIGALYVHLKSKEKEFSIQKLEELMQLLENRREGAYLRELLTE